MLHKFKVTQEHIDNGRQRSGDQCALALCFKEQTNAFPWVSREEVFFDPDPHARGGSQSVSVCLPMELQRFIITFDSEKCFVQPFEFELDVPPEVIKTQEPACASK